MADEYAKTTVKQRTASVGLIKQIADSDPVETIDGIKHCRYCGARDPETEGHDTEDLCLWILSYEIMYPRKAPVDQSRQDVHDFLVQLQSYRNHAAPISVTLDTLNANLGRHATDRIEQAVMARLLEVHPGDVFKEGA